MTNKIFSSLKVIALAVVLSFGLSYVYAWTAPSATPPTGNVSAPINTSATEQTKAGPFNVVNSVNSTYPNIGSFSFNGTSGVPHFSITDNSPGGTIVQQFRAKDGSGTSQYFNQALNVSTKTFTLSGPGADTVIVDKIKTTGGLVGNGPIPLTLHYVNRSEDTYSGPWAFFRYCNGWSPHDTCNGDYNSLFTCSKSANIASCTDSYPYPSGTRTDWGWCGAYFYDRTVSCRPNEVLSTYDDNI